MNYDGGVELYLTNSKPWLNNLDKTQTSAALFITLKSHGSVVGLCLN